MVLHFMDSCHRFAQDQPTAISVLVVCVTVRVRLTLYVPQVLCLMINQKTSLDRKPWMDEIPVIKQH